MKWRTFDGKLGNATQALERACLSFCHVFLFRGSLHRSPRCYTSATSIFHLTAGVGPSRELWVHLCIYLSHFYIYARVTQCPCAVVPFMIELKSLTLRLKQRTAAIRYLQGSEEINISDQLNCSDFYLPA